MRRSKDIPVNCLEKRSCEDFVDAGPMSQVTEKFL